MICIEFSFVFDSFVTAFSLSCVNCPPVRAESRIIQKNAHSYKSVLIHLADSGLQLDFRIARSAGPSVGRLRRLLPSGRRCVGKSDHVIQRFCIRSSSQASSLEFIKDSQGLYWLGGIVVSDELGHSALASVHFEALRRRDTANPESDEQHSGRSALDELSFPVRLRE